MNTWNYKNQVSYFFSCRYSHVDALIVEMKTKKIYVRKICKGKF